MWVHEGGISTPLIVSWPKGIPARGTLTRAVGHIIDLMPTCLELAGVEYPATLNGHPLTPLAGQGLVPVFQGKSQEPRTLAWEHEGNRAIRVGDWKLVAQYGGEWELYDLKNDRTELHSLANDKRAKAKELAAQWQQWADHVGVVPWDELPGARYKPSHTYRKKSEPVAP